MLRVRVAVVEGRPVVVKEAASGPAAERLRHEARVLVRAAHPRVVDLIRATDDGAGIALTLAYVDGRRLDDDEVRADVGLVASLTAELAETLAELHQRGVVHTRLTPDHVLATTDGHVVLVGLGDAGLADEGDTADGTADVTALGRLVLGLVGEQDDERATALRAVAARAVAGEMGAAGVAAAVRRVASPLVVLPRRRPGRPLRRVVGGAVAVAALALAAVPATAGLLGAGSGEAQFATTTASPPASSGSGRGPAPSTLTSRPVPPGQADGVIERDGQRWRIGAPGDVAVLGDWDCDGELTPALLRPSTGEVWRWSRWPDSATAQAGEVVGRAEGAVGLQVADVDGDACEDLVPVGSDGSVLPPPG